MKSAPPLLLGTAALFWGWQIDVPLAGAAVALLADGMRFLPYRIEPTREQFYRIADFCSVLLALALAWMFATRGAAGAVLGAFQWMPLVLLPLALACALARRDTLDLATLFLFMRRRLRAAGGRSPGSFHFGYTYLSILLVGASIANREGPWFFLALLAFCLWSLLGAAWPRRPAPAFYPAFAAAALIGYAASIGLHSFQGWLTDVAADWFSGNTLLNDPYRSRSSLGTLGRLKAHGRIIGRIYAPRDAQPPGLLRQASYDRYLSPNWIARDAPLAPLAAGTDGRTWSLAANLGSARELRVVLEAPDHAAMLALPRDAFEIRELLAEEVKRNRLGAVRAHMEAPRIPYTVRYGARNESDSAPGAADLDVPIEEGAALDAVLAEAGGLHLTPTRRLAAIAHLFATRFRYSLYREAGSDPRATPLARFLLETRAGHCEFFATASVLLARRAGIPARYATGFSVQEWSEREGAFILRLRHAHAWAQVWANGAWQDFDTTPPDWSDAEARSDGTLRALADLWQWFAYLLGEHPGETRELPWWVFPTALALAVIYFAARLVLSRRERLITRRVVRGKLPEGDDPLGAIEARLARAGHVRAPGETLTDFAARIARSAPALARSLGELFAAHYRARFDPRAPAGLAAEFEHRVRSWLAAQRPD